MTTRARLIPIALIALVCAGIVAWPARAMVAPDYLILPGRSIGPVVVEARNPTCFALLGNASRSTSGYDGYSQAGVGGQEQPVTVFTEPRWSRDRETARWREASAVGMKSPSRHHKNRTTPLLRGSRPSSSNLSNQILTLLMASPAVLEIHRSRRTSQPLGDRVTA